VRAIAHITGGGLVENPPRVLPANTAMRLYEGGWPEPALFGEIAKAGVAREELRRTFNLGLGLLLIVPAGAVAAVGAACRGAGEAVFEVGVIEAAEGEPRVVFDHG
jgi:phosphoribosylformylglycinamidine cyclo-ligase